MIVEETVALSLFTFAAANRNGWIWFLHIVRFGDVLTWSRD